MGDWDFYIACAERYGWTPAQVDALDAEYADELRAYIGARIDHDDKRRREWERQQGRR